MWLHILTGIQVAEHTRHSSCGCVVFMPGAIQPALAKTDVICKSLHGAACLKGVYTV